MTGVKTKISIEGNVTRDKVLKIFELMEMINIEEHDNGPKIDSVGGKNMVFGRQVLSYR